MTQDPLQRLLDEHVTLTSRFEPLRLAVRALAEGGESALKSALPATGAELLEQLDAHFGKEEQILFPIAPHELSAQALREVARRMDELDAE